VSLVNNTIAGNQTAYASSPDWEEGGGVSLWLDNPGVVDLHNNIFWDNQATNGADLFIENNEGASVNAYHNILDPAKVSGAFTAEGGNMALPPLFADPGAGDYHLTAGSPAIDAGSNEAPYLPGGDLDGEYRVQDGDADGAAFCDLGAYEYAGAFVACDDGIDNDGDGLVDFAEDPGCETALDPSELGSFECDDGIDNDGDGWTDHPADPGCYQAASRFEHAPCQDGEDNDGDGRIDFDGGVSAGLAPQDQRDPDPHCSHPWSREERTGGWRCGLSAELALLLPPLLWLLRKRSRTA
jgi:hypothetical protein